MSRTKRIKDRTTPRRADWRDHLPNTQPITLTAKGLARKHLEHLEGEDSPSIDDWRTFYREFVADFGDIPIDQHTATMWEGWLRARASDSPPAASKTIAKKLGLAGAAYQFARRLRAIERNPIPDVDRALRPSRKVRNPQRAPLSVLMAAELLVLFGTSKTQRRLRFFDRLFYSAAALTGQRFGELAGADVGDFHEDTSPLPGINIDKQWHTKSRRIRTVLKDKSNKYAPVHPVLFGLLKLMPHEFALRTGRQPRPDDPLFPFFPEGSSEIRRWNQRTSLRRWREFQADVGIAEPVCGPRTFHHLRHTFISRLVCDGADEPAVRSCTHPTGVSSNSDPFTLYRHMSWEAKCRAVLKLNLDSDPAPRPRPQLGFDF